MEWIDFIYPTPGLVTGDPRPRQEELGQTLTAEPDDRTVIFVVDPEGGVGKSWFIKWWQTEHSELTQILSIGKRDDLALTIDESKRYFLFDIPRSQSEYLQYSVLESLKDRIVFSPKYGTSDPSMQLWTETWTGVRHLHKCNALFCSFNFMGLRNPTCS